MCKNFKECFKEVNQRGYTIIKPSVYITQAKDAVLFRAYDKVTGEVYYFYISFATQYASREYVSPYTLKKFEYGISYWFFD